MMEILCISAESRFWFLLLKALASGPCSRSLLLRRPRFIYIFPVFFCWALTPFPHSGTDMNYARMEYWNKWWLLIYINNEISRNNSFIAMIHLIRHFEINYYYSIFIVWMNEQHWPDVWKCKLKLNCHHLQWQIHIIHFALLAFIHTKTDWFSSYEHELLSVLLGCR